MRRVLVVATAFAVLTSAGEASAATIEAGTQYSGGRSYQHYVIYRAAPSERNDVTANVSVTPADPNTYLVSIHDAGASVTPAVTQDVPTPPVAVNPQVTGVACAAAGSDAVCSIRWDPSELSDQGAPFVTLDLGDEDDRAKVANDDPGIASVQGGDGDDTIDLRNGDTDFTSTDCGAGADTAFADALSPELNGLRNCETVTTT